MKKNLFVLAILVATGFVNANAAAVNLVITNHTVVAATPPAAVLQAFKSVFGNVAVKEWKLRSRGEWRAHFLRNGIK